jgi:hypothetical protein
VTLATWNIARPWGRDEASFTLKLVEPQGRLQVKIPFNFYTRAEFPALEPENVGRPIPEAYGVCVDVVPTCVDVGAKRFHVASHALREFSAVRIQSQRVEARSATIDADAWELYAGTTYRYYLPGETADNVTFDAASLTAENSIADCEAAAGSWTNIENYVYVNPSGGETISSGDYVIESSKELSVYQDSNFATVDTANAEFTLGDDWSPGQAVSVDLIGKADGAAVMDNAADVIADLLETAGETNLNAASFSAAHDRFDIGTDENGRRVSIRKLGLYLVEPKAVIEIISEINYQIGALLYSDASGEYFLKVFEPQTGEGLTVIGDGDVLDFAEVAEGNQDNKAFSEVKASYLIRKQQKYSASVTRTNEANQFAVMQPAAVVKQAELFLTQEADVKDWADRVLITEGRPVKRFTIVEPWQGLLTKPGDQFLLQYAARGLDQVVEVVDVKIDLGNKRVTLGLGDLRGFDDAVGHWVDDAATLPARFSALAGYGVGSLVWNSAWHPEIKRWARQNVGYWTDANGFADSADPDSFIPSSWV